MPDNDIRARLAEALLDCHMVSKAIPIDVYEIADTVLSLPGIAVVDRELLDRLMTATQGLTDAANRVADHG